MGKRRIVISDTRPTETILNAAKGADLLVHEATYPDTNALTAHKHRHCTVTEAANLAVKAHVGALALTHTGSRYSKQNTLKEAGKIFPLVLVPSPLDRIYIESASDRVKNNNFGWGQLRLAGEKNN
jgi:ribonuclease Z